MRLPDHIASTLHTRRVMVLYADKATIALWNDRRAASDIRAFTGWYWLGSINGEAREGGPFRSQSAAERDAHYYVITGAPPPILNPDVRRYTNNVVHMRKRA